MTERCYVSTRKGLFSVERTRDGWSVNSADFLGDHVSMFLQDPRDGWMYAAFNHGHFGAKLHRTADGGQSWEECAVPVYPDGAVVATRPPADGPPGTKPASLSEIWALEAAGNNQPGQIWAGTIPGGLFTSRDRGTTWELNEPLWNRPERMEWFGGGKDDPGVHTICVHPQHPQHMRVAVSCGGVWQTEDGGHTWECRGKGLRADYMPPDLAGTPHIQDVHRLAFCGDHTDSLWIQHHNGIFRSTNGARTWKELSVKPSGFGFAVAAHPHDPQTAWFVPGVKDECRVPVGGKLVVTRTTDGGESFGILSQGLPQKHCYDIIYRHALDVDETGTFLAMGSTTGSLWISEDSGDSWSTVSSTLPPIHCVRFHREKL